jgi:hypothetical protein
MLKRCISVACMLLIYVAFGQHPRAVDTQDATVQVITPCYAWGEAWVA